MTEPKYLTKAEVEKLIEQLTPEFAPIAACCFYGGLRISEALALRWGDVDFEGSRISVRAGKTKASVADVPLLPRLATILREHREHQGRLGFARIAQDALVFITATGRSQGRRNALRAVNVASEGSGLSRTAKSALAEVLKLLRHANPQVTLTVYAGIAGDHVETLSTKLTGLGAATETRSLPAPSEKAEIIDIADAEVLEAEDAEWEVITA